MRKGVEAVGVVQEVTALTIHRNIRIVWGSCLGRRKKEEEVLRRRR